MKLNKGCFPASPVRRSTCVLSSLMLTITTALPLMADDTTNTEIMVVVSNRVPKAISDIPGTVWYIDADDIELATQGGSHLSEILAANIPSLDISTGARTNYGQNVRGRKMLVMIDGISLQSSRPISRQLDAINPFNIERIEVLSGASAIYGAGASGGVINIITKKANQEETEFETLVGATSGFNNSEDGDIQIAQSIAGGNETIQARAAVVYQQTQAFYDANGEIVTPDISQGSLQYNDTLDVLTTASITLSDSQTINLLGQYYDSQQDSPYGLYIVGRDFIDVRKGFESDRQHGTERIMLSAAYNDHAFIGGHQLLAEVSYRREDQTFTPYYQGASQQTTDVINAKALLSKSVGKLNLVYGLDAYRDKLDSNQALFDPTTANNSGNLINQTYAQVGRYPGVEVSSLAGFIQADYAITDRWSIDGGFRYQTMNNAIDDFVAYSIQKKIAAGQGSSADAVPGGETSYNISLFNIGTLYELSDTSQVWVNYSQGFELADPAKYYGQGTYDSAPGANGHWNLINSINVGSSRMEGIKTSSVEIGFRTELDDLSLQSAAYYSESDNSIKYNRSTLLIEKLDDEQRIYGLEGLASYWFTPSLNVGLAGHYVVSEVETDEGWEKISAGQASTSKATAWLGWQGQNLTAKLQSQSMFSYTDDADNKLDGYTVVDLMGSYQLPVGHLGFGIQNLLDNDYTTVWGQRAQILYARHYAADAYDYRGRGRNYTLTYHVTY
uniref:TonB-dependent receptor n=1 Tax=Thaumasiovibrio occultus TaxID=1891184 RepID=UPI000B35A23E|nr:TonB-dependent receptor [Thaumasiovibrio occultus]